MVWWNEKDDFCIYSLECCPHFYYEDRLTSWHGHPSVTLLVSIWYPRYHWPLAVTSAGLPTSSVWSPWPDCGTGQRRRPCDLPGCGELWLEDGSRGRDTISWMELKDREVLQNISQIEIWISDNVCRMVLFVQKCEKKKFQNLSPHFLRARHSKVRFLV